MNYLYNIQKSPFSQSGCCSSQSVVVAPNIEQNIPLVQYLSTNGDGTGDIEAIGDYTVPDIFYIEAQVGEILIISRLVIELQDTGSLDAEGFGNGVALVNGYEISCTLGGTKYRLDGGVNTKTNAGLGHFSYDVEVKTWGTGDEILLCRYSFNKFIQNGIVLESGDKIEITFNDDQTRLNGFSFIVEGYFG